MLRRVIRSSAVAVAAVGLLAGCAAPSPQGSSGPETPEAPATVAAPLTGMQYLPADLAHPALSAKIDNHEDARPQWGLEKTDIVFEELVEGGLTRYVAVWHSQVPNSIGPVRSIRPMDPDIITPFGGIVAYSGGQQKFVSMMKATPIYNAVHGASDTSNFMYRSDKRDAPHNVVVKAKELVASKATLTAPQTMFTFAKDAQSATAVVSGNETKAIKVTFSGERYPTWNWDAASQTYLRSQQGKVDKDTTGKPFSATNVITMSMQISRQYGYVPKTIMVGKGKGTISTGGKTIAVNWSKASREAPIVYTDAAGAVVSLAPGNTWIEMPPTYGSVKLVAAPKPATATPTPSK